GTITSAGPLPVTASGNARAIAPGTSWGRTGSSTHTGYSPARPRSLPARNGSVARWRRSCWPTTTTSGARLTRAVASAPTALPSPAVVCRITSAGSPCPSAQPVAMTTTELSCSASTKRKSSGRSVSSLISVEPGFAKIDVSPYSRHTSKVAWRTVFTATRTAYTAALPIHKSFDFCPVRCDDEAREGDVRRRGGRRRCVDGLQSGADAGSARGRDHGRPAGDDHVARDGLRAGARAAARHRSPRR